MAVTNGDFVRLTVKMKLFGTDDVMNVLTYRVDRNDTADDEEFMEDAALFLDIAYTLMLPDISEDLTWVTLDGQNISKSELLPEVPYPVITNGDNTANLLPTQCAAEVYWPTITPKVRTSLFMGGFTVSASTDIAEVGAATRTRLASFGDAIRLWNTVDIDAKKGSWNPTKLLFTVSQAAVVPSRWRTQRRRRLGVGS